MVEIIKGGLTMTIPQALFDKLYKPNGWVINGFAAPPSDPTQGLETVKEISNLNRMNKSSPRVFTDGLLKSEEI